MKISYAILTHNEGQCIEDLLVNLLENKQSQDEIVVVDDFSIDTLTKHILLKYQDKIKLEYRVFDGDATSKNYLNSLCGDSDFLVQLDADENLSPEFITLLPSILEFNPEVELFSIGRINTVEGLTQEYINKWGWVINEKQYINFPDYQNRIYKNTPEIKWEGLLHSKIIGHKTHAYLPTEDMFCLIHPKTLDRQIAQNNLYDKIEETGRTKYKV